jgi:membrane fusion protein (multidrug efflux system)
MKRPFELLLLMVVSMVIFSRCSNSKIEAKSMEQLYKENGIPVKVQVIKPRPFVVEETYPAVLSGINESSASAMVTDKVDKIHFKVGDSVSKDAVVVTFPTDNPGAQYFQAKVAFEHAESTLRRMQNLYDNGGISLQELENTKTQFNVTKANWEAVSQAVKVRAPISGIITQIDVHESDNVTPGTRLFTVSQLQKLKAKLWVPESQISKMRAGNKATATWGDTVLEGKVSQVDISLNTKQQAFGVMLEFENPKQAVPSGVNADIVIQAGNERQAIIIDRKNIIKQDQKNIVYVAANGMAQEREIQLGAASGLDIEVLSGLNAGDLLIVEGQHLLKNGDKIRVIE